MIIGLCGKFGSGKDTIAQYINDNYCAMKWAFANKLKEIAADLFDVKTKDARGRSILQQLGTKMREIDENVWVNYVINRIKSISEYSTCLHVISDVRFENEVESVISSGGIVIYLDVDSETRRERCSIRESRVIGIDEWTKASAHISETCIDDVANRFHGNKNFIRLLIEKDDNIETVSQRIGLIINEFI